METEVGRKKALEGLGGKNLGVLRREREMRVRTVAIFRALMERECSLFAPLSRILTNGWHATRTAVVLISPARQ